jgi:parallel beta-helix repeat protein
MRRFYNFFLKLTLLSLFIGYLTTAGFAATYYVSSTGNDANAGTSSSTPWKTLAKVNSVTLIPGDQVLFQRGNTFYGSLTVKNSGTSGNTIKLGAYGTGNNPIIGGFVTPNSWVSYGNGIYYATLDVPRLNIVTLDGVVKGMGRFPENGYMNYESHNSKVSITDNQLAGSPNWTGAEICIRKYRWILDRHTITNHSAGTITYSSNTDYGNATIYEPLDKNGYFIQNHIGCLNDLGDWCYNGSEKRIYMYFGSGGPSGHTVQAGNNDKNLTISNQSYVDVTSLNFEGANINGLYLTGSNNISIIDCNFNNQGGNAIYGLSSSYIKVIGGSIVNALNNGIFFEWDVNNATVDGLTIINAGIIPGASKSGDGTSVGLYVAGNNAVVKNCKVTKTGYNGIHFNGDDALIENNTIDSFCTQKDDGGGIYTYSGVRAIIRNNIVLNAIGAYAGAEYGYWEPFGKAAGIYLDNGTASHNATLSGNSLAHGEWAGIFINDNGGNSLLNNVVFNFREQLLIIEYSLGKIRNTTITGNQFIAKSSTQKAFFNQMYVSESPSLFGTFNNNYYVRPIDDNLTIQTTTDGNTLIQKTLEGWKTYSGQDANSYKSPQSITSEADLQFEYNATQSTKTVSLSRPMVDFKGMKYQGTFTLQPYSSLVLMKDNSVSSVLPVLYTVTGGGSYTSGGPGVPIGLSNSQVGVNYQVKLNGVNDGNVIAGTGSTLSFGNKTVAGTYTVVATLVSSGSTATMTGSATVIINSSSTLVTGVSVSPTSTSILTGSTQQLTATVLPSNATNKTVTWSSSNTTVATVNSVGLVTAIASGSAVITVKTQDGSKTASSTINVSSTNTSSTGSTIGSNVIGSLSETADNGHWIASKFTATSNISVNRISLYASQASGTARMAIYTSNSAGEPATLLAQTGDISLITGWNSGTLGLSQTLVAGATYWLAFEVSSSSTQVRYNSSYGQSRYKLFAYGPFPSIAPSTTIGTGIYSIYADNNGLIASTLVTGVSVSPTSTSILTGSTQQLTATVLPSNATNKTVTWSSSNTTVATVNSVGLVTAIASGSAVITVKTQDGSKTASSTINVSSTNTSSTGSTIGSNVIGSLSETADNGHWIASKFTATSNISVNRISLYASQASGTARMAIYTSNSAGEPATLLAQTGDISLITGWNSGTLGLSQTLVAGATYWLAFEVSSSSTQVRYNSSYGQSRYKLFAYGPFPSIAPSTTIGTGIYSIYADNNGLKNGNIDESAGVTGIEDLSQQTKIEVFPNPSKGNITVHFSILPEIGSRIEIMDISGKIITSRIISENDMKFNLDQQPNGIYLVKSIFGSSATVQKLILNK